MAPPIGTVVAGVNTRTGLTEAPATPPEVIEVKTIPVTATVSKATDNPASALGPFRFMLSAAVPHATLAAFPAVQSRQRYRM